MSKYALAKQAIHDAVETAAGDGIEADEMLLAMIVATVAEYRAASGAEAAAAALTYELGELEGAIDTQFMRAR